MLSSFRISRQFVAAAALAFGAVGFTPALSGAGGKPAPAKAVPTVNYDAIFNSEKFKFLQDYILEESVRPNLTDEFLRNGAKAGIKKYLETLPAGETSTPEGLETAALKGMFDTLTPHDSYFTKKESTAMSERMASSFVGLGININPQDKQIKVIAPIPGGPAARVGIKTGDIVKEVNGIALDGLEQDDAIKIMRGESGSRATVKVLRDGAMIEFDIIRAAIKQTKVHYAMLQGGIAHIHVAEFAENVSTDVKYAIARAKADAQLDHAQKAKGGLKGIILDFTSNGGGLITESNIMSDDFLDKKGPIVTQQGRTAEHTERHASTFGDIIKDMNMVVLVNEESASASEIVAGALQDHDRATIIGRTTFGKGTVQSVRVLSDGTMSKITTGIFKRPSGTSNQWIGVVPDILVNTRSTAYEKYMTDVKTERSLPNSLPNLHGIDAQKDKTKFICSPLQDNTKISEGETDKNVFFQNGQLAGEINPFVACARDYLLQKADPAYVSRFTATLPKAPALTN